MGNSETYQQSEHARLISRPELDVFDRNPDPALDELTELAAVLSLADYAYIGWMEFNRLWFKSRYGFTAANQPDAETACQWVMKNSAPFLVRDAAEDGRFSPEGIEVPGGERCRSYAGVPLISERQQVVGTLAVLARQPGQFRAEHLTLLEVMGRQVMTRLELYNRMRSQEQALRMRQRTERALAVERCFVAATLDSIPALVAVLDTAGRVVRFNESCAQLTGLSLADSTGRSFVEEVLEAQDREWAAGTLQSAGEGHVSGPHETAWRIRGGPSRRVSWTIRPLQGPTGEIQYLIISGQDVTDQREAERALLSSEARYREVVEGSLGFVFTCTM
jgi:two-component system, OmpR family, sensor histidine kinase VicK